MNDRERDIRDWRVLMAQQAAFWRRDNGTRYFAFTLLEWAGNARRRALTPQAKPGQQELPI